MTKNIDESDANLDKSISITPTITALLKPTATYLGIELRNYIKETIEELKNKKREGNITSHLEAVRIKLSKDNLDYAATPSTLEQLEFFEIWIKEVQNIDPDNVELSEIWHQLLVNAVRGDAVQKEVLEVIQSLTPMEAQFLLEFNKRQFNIPFLSISNKNQYLAKSLESKGILHRDYTMGITFTVTMLFIAYFALNANRAIQSFSASTIFVLIFSGLLTLLALQISLQRWRFSWLGSELMRRIS